MGEIESKARLTDFLLDAVFFYSFFLTCIASKGRQFM